ncbi:hypothetical protein HY439_02680 [Candidatus Microgenomates bacterium]|nr:hypothetical protein [Candidatus Microgenomates bacterium]
MKNSFKKILNNPPYLWGIVFTVVVILFSVFLLVLNWQNLPPQVPIFYNRLWGEDQLGKREELLLLPSIAFVFFIINILLATKIYLKEGLISLILIWTASFLAFAGIFTLLQIIRIVG